MAIFLHVIHTFLFFGIIGWKGHWTTLLDTDLNSLLPVKWNWIKLIRVITIIGHQKYLDLLVTQQHFFPLVFTPNILSEQGKLG